MPASLEHRERMLAHLEGQTMSRVGSYGFTCGYCETNLDTPFDDDDRAAQFAQEQGWRMTFGPSPRWGDGAHNSCPNCAEGDKDALAIWVKPSGGVA